MNLFQKWWGKNKKEESTPNIGNKTETYLDIVISLNKNNQIDFTLFIDDKIEKIPMNIVDYSIICGEFIHSVLSTRMKKDALDVLDKQIKTNHNELLINNIISVVNIMDKPQTKINQPFIKPSEVFAKYVI